ncbi:hypothetical protein [Demequina aurantiaca]|uniref:hypothetical protein n=1 Tax=Demequina aurantiaca TaxID=676200 RepID=UPI003D341D53
MRRLKRVRSDADQMVTDRRNARQGNGFEYLAIHDGRTLNASVLAGVGLSRLQLVGDATVALPAPSTEGKSLVWVVDLLGLGVAPGTYRLTGIGDGGEAHSTFPPPQGRSLSDEPMADGKVADLAQPAAAITLLDRAVGIVITAGDALPHLVSLNYYGPDALRIEASSADGNQRLVAIAREGGTGVVIGEVVDGVGVVRLTDLEPPDSGEAQRWDVSLQDGAGVARELHGPALDYNHPDKTTSYGDISKVSSGIRSSWKPYISRAGVLAVLVSSTQVKDAS